MTDEQRTAMFDRLAKTMISAGLEWPLEQVQEEIRFGRRATKRVRAAADVISTELTFSPEKRTRRNTVNFAATRPFSPREQLELLINAIEQAVIATYEMETIIGDHVSRFGKRQAPIYLVHEGESAEGIAILSHDGVRHEHVGQLKRLLVELRATI